MVAEVCSQQLLMVINPIGRPSPGKAHCMLIGLEEEHSR